MQRHLMIEMAVLRSESRWRNDSQTEVIDMDIGFLYDNFLKGDYIVFSIFFLFLAEGYPLNSTINN